MPRPTPKVVATRTEGKPKGVPLACANGHSWQQGFDAQVVSSCPHGQVIGEDGTLQDVQAELNCMHCGAGLSVVGEVGYRDCPRCGNRMACPKCLAGRRDEQVVQVQCPTCGSAPVTSFEPEVRFAGDVNVTIKLHGEVH